MDEPRFYEIRVEGQLTDLWSNWFEGLAIQPDSNGKTKLSGQLSDQAALFGVLNNAFGLAGDSRLSMGLGTVIVSHISFSVPFVTLVVQARLAGFDKAYEEAAMDLGANELTTFWRVTLPLCLPALMDVFRYFFVSAMTTVSCVIFLYTPDTVLASVSVLNMDDAGDTAAAAAMATLIVFTSFFINLILHMLTNALEARHQRWQKPLTKES